MASQQIFNKELGTCTTIFSINSRQAVIETMNWLNKWILTILIFQQVCFKKEWHLGFWSINLYEGKNVKAVFTWGCWLQFALKSVSVTVSENGFVIWRRILSTRQSVS